MKPETKRLIAAVVLAPLALAFVFGTLGVASAGLEGAIIIFCVIFVIAFPTTIIVGVPTHFALRNRGQYNLAPYLFAALLIGFIPAVATGIAGLINSDGTWLMMWVAGFYTIPSCLFTAAVAWAIARPDRGEAAMEIE